MKKIVIRLLFFLIILSLIVLFIININKNQKDNTTTKTTTTGKLNIQTNLDLLEIKIDNKISEYLKKDETYSISLNEGLHHLSATKEGYYKQIFDFNTKNSENYILNISLKNLPKLNFGRLVTGRNISSYWFMSDNIVAYTVNSDLYTLENGIQNIFTNEVFKKVLFTNGKFALVEDSTGSKYLYSYPKTLEKIQVNGQFLALLPDGRYIVDGNKKLAVYSKNELIQEIKLKSDEKFMSLSQNSLGTKLAILSQNKTFSRVNLFNFVGNSYIKVYESKDESITKILISPMGDRVALITKNKIIMINELGMIINEYLLDVGSYIYSWLNDDNFIVIGQLKNDVVSQLYLISPAYEGKSLITQTYSIDKGINFLKELVLSGDQSKLLLMDNDSSLWILQSPVEGEMDKGF